MLHNAVTLALVWPSSSSLSRSLPPPLRHENFSLLEPDEGQRRRGKADAVLVEVATVAVRHSVRRGVE